MKLSHYRILQLSLENIVKGINKQRLSKNNEKLLIKQNIKKIKIKEKDKDKRKY